MRTGCKEFCGGQEWNPWWARWEEKNLWMKETEKEWLAGLKNKTRKTR